MNGAPRGEDLVDLLLEMKHDLGKYIVMPVAMLPSDASEEAVRGALTRALRETRPGRSRGEHPRDAKGLWRHFVAEGGSTLQRMSGFAELEVTVERALRWNDALDDGRTLERGAVLSDLRAVGERLGAMIASCGEES